MYLVSIITETDETSMAQRLFTAKSDAIAWMDGEAERNRISRLDDYDEEWEREDIRGSNGEYFYLRWVENGSYVQTYFVTEIRPDDPGSMPTVGL